VVLVVEEEEEGEGGEAARVDVGGEEVVVVGLLLVMEEEEEAEGEGVMGRERRAAMRRPVASWKVRGRTASVGQRRRTRR